MAQSFKEAFRAARSAGKKEFTWNGSRYNTKIKEEVGTPGASRPRPRNKPTKATTPTPTDFKITPTPAKSTDSLGSRILKAGTRRPIGESLGGRAVKAVGRAIGVGSLEERRAARRKRAGR
jgi:hypothetical protein